MISKGETRLQTRKLHFLLKCLIALLLCAGSTELYGQDTIKMKLVLDKISYDGVQISIGEAKKLSEKSSPLAYEQFRKAQKMNTWNYVWASIGGVLIGNGLVVVTIGEDPTGLIDIAAGGVLASIPYWKNRRTRQLMYVKQGIAEYNK